MKDDKITLILVSDVIEIDMKKDEINFNKYYFNGEASVLKQISDNTEALYYFDSKTFIF